MRLRPPTLGQSASQSKGGIEEHNILKSVIDNVTKDGHICGLVKLHIIIQMSERLPFTYALPAMS